MKRCALLCLLALSSSAALAQVYRWVDEQGKVHYGDRPVAKEIKNVPVVRATTPVDNAPKPGMTAEEAKRLYGQPDNVRIVKTKSGDSQYWAYFNPKGRPRGFMLKFEGGEVTEVTEDSALNAPAAVTAEKGAPADDRQRQAQAETEVQDRAKSRAAAQCAALKRELDDIEAAQRRGGPGATMDRLRDRQRDVASRMNAGDCSRL